jgi:hypothetical protein
VELCEALADSAPGASISRAELSELASNLPGVTRALIAMHRRVQAAAERAETLASRLGAFENAIAEPIAPMPYEEVRDFFYAHRNYLHEPDALAERIAGEIALLGGDPGARLGERPDRRAGALGRTLGP